MSRDYMDAIRVPMALDLQPVGVGAPTPETDAVGREKVLQCLCRHEMPCSDHPEQGNSVPVRTLKGYASGGSSAADLAHGLQDRLAVPRPHQTFGLFAITQENPRRPEVYPERTTEAPAGTILYLDMAQLGMGREGLLQRRLGSAAVTAPVGAKFHQGCPR